MRSFVKVNEPMMRYLSLFIFLLLIASLISIWLSPPASSALGIVSLLSSPALSTYAIYEKHKRTDHARAKIIKDMGVMALTLVIILFLGGWQMPR